jgi:phage shock protein C
MNERLFRSVDDRVVAGVCGGIAVRLAIDPSLVRVAFAVLTLLTGIFPFLVLYVIMAVIVPEEPTGFAGRSPTPPGPGAVPGWAPPGEGTGPESPPWDETAAGLPVAPVASAWPPVSAAGSLPADQAGTEPAQVAWTPSPPTMAGGDGRPRRGADRTLGLIGGIVLVALGVWFLVRDRLDIDWGVVWAAGLMALGVVIVVAAIRPRR